MKIVVTGATSVTYVLPLQLRKIEHTELYTICFCSQALPEFNKICQHPLLTYGILNITLTKESASQCRRGLCAQQSLPENKAEISVATLDFIQ